MTLATRTAVFGLTLSLSALFGCTSPEPLVLDVITPEPALPSWPDVANLRQIAPLTSSSVPRIKLLIDAGHGASGNEGNIGVRCQTEADEMRRLADGVVERLNTRRLVTTSTRPTGSLVSYGARLSKANGWADLMISLHSDVRELYAVETHPETGCRSVDDAHGFTVLWSDEGSALLTRRRHDLAVAIAQTLTIAGFFPFANGYGTLYDADPEVAGVYVDRHEPRQRIYLLRRPTVPTVIVETHNALDIDEVDRWSDDRTLDAFASALRAAVITFYEDILKGG